MYEPKWKDAHTDELCQALLSLRDMDECNRFIDDLCTIAEVKAMAQRWMVVRMLQEGYTYEEIAHRTGASTATISRVKRCLHYGADGYKMALDRLGVTPKEPVHE